MNELSIIIPCVSSVDILPGFIDRLATYLMSNPSQIDIIIVANESAGSMRDIVHYIRKKYPWLKFEILQRKGYMRSYGALVRFGMAYSTSHYVVLLSPYGEDDIGLIMPMLQKIRDGFQVVQATRYACSADTKRVQLRFRIYQYFYRFSTKLLLGFSISDSTYAFKMFDRVFIQALGLNQNGYSICPEITFKALLSEAKVAYISSKFNDTVINRDFKLCREGIGYFWLLIRGFVHRLGILWF